MTYQRKEVIGRATLYLGDIRDVAPEISGADLACTDPPYLVSKGGVAANLQLDRDFVGVEEDQRWFDIACRRIEDAQRQGSLFGAAA